MMSFTVQSCVCLQVNPADSGGLQPRSRFSSRWDTGNVPLWSFIYCVVIVSIIFNKSNAIH